MNAIKSIILFLAMCILLYAMWSFVGLQINATKWSESFRLTYSFVITISAVASLLYYLEISNNKDDE